MSWHSLHVHYHDDQDELILSAVRPLFDRLRDQVPAAYFTRHWKRGPHLRLNFDTEPPAFARTVVPAARAIVGGHLAARPSRVAVDEGALLTAHRRLAEVEREPGPLAPLRPDNTILEAPYDARVATLGSPAAADLLARFYVATTPAAFAAIETARAGGSRLNPCFDLLIATVHAFSGGGLRRGFVSLRSHAELFLAGTDDMDRRRAEWDRHYRRVAPALRARVGEITSRLDALDAHEAHAPYGTDRVLDWVRTVRPVAAEAGRLVAAGLPAGELGVPPPRPGVVSPFHAALGRDPVFAGQVRDAPWFHRYRLLLNFTYLHLTRLGVAPAQRFLLCHLAANAAEDVLGVTALDLLPGTGR